MFFSIIVPIYNSEKTLMRCLNSVKNQSFQNFECIIVNDGSHDSSEEICREITETDSRFKYIYQDNSGVATARNRGISEAKGAYITFIDSDDEYKCDYLASFYELIQNNPCCNNYWCGFQYVSDNPAVNRHEVLFTTSEKVTFSDRKDIMTLHNKNLEASPVNKVYRRSIIAENEIKMRRHLSLGEDLIFNYEYLDANPDSQIIILNQAEYLYYCFSEDSLNHRYRDNLYNIDMEIIECIDFYIKKWGVPQRQVELFYLYVFYMLERVLKNTFSPNNSLSYKEKIQYNNMILHNPQFIKALQVCKNDINVVFRAAYCSKNYRVVRLCEKLVQLKDKLIQ